MADKVTVQVKSLNTGKWDLVTTLTREDADRFIAQAKISLALEYRIKEDA